MKLTIFTSDGGELEIKEFAASDAMELVEALEAGEQEVFHFDLGDGGQSYVMREHLVRLDLD